MGNNAGRPPKYKSKKELQAKIDEYFSKCEGEIVVIEGEAVRVGARPLTITGLALALGFNSRQSLLNYQEKEEFLDTIARAKSRVEQYAEEKLFDKGSSNGAKFSLMNNFEGWKEKQDIEEKFKVTKLEDLI